jgi:hypothetical protein
LPLDAFTFSDLDRPDDEEPPAAERARIAAAIAATRGDRGRGGPLP